MSSTLPADGSVYGGSEDDAFFDNILPGELDLDVTEAPPAPRAETSPSSPTGGQDRNADQARSGDTASSSCALARPTRAAVSSRDNSGSTSDAPRPARLRLADAIRGGAPPGGAGPSRGDKRPNASELEGQKRQRTS